jgi:hypothetical protein
MTVIIGKHEFCMVYQNIFFAVKKIRMLKLATLYNVYETNKEYMQNFGQKISR